MQLHTGAVAEATAFMKTSSRLSTHSACHGEARRRRSLQSRKVAEECLWRRRMPLHVLPHFDSKEPFVQNYAEEAVCLGGSCGMASTTSCPGYTYVPHGTVSPRHISFEGSLFFRPTVTSPARTGCILPATGTASEPSIDWSQGSLYAPGTLPLGPKGICAPHWIWKEPGTHITKQGEVTDKHFCRLDIGITESTVREIRTRGKPRTEVSRRRKSTSSTENSTRWLLQNRQRKDRWMGHSH